MKPIELLRRLQAGDHEWDEKARLYQSVKQRLSDRSELEDTRGTQRQSAEKLANAQSQLRDGELRLESLQEKTRGVEADLYSGRIRSPGSWRTCARIACSFGDSSQGSKTGSCCAWRR